MGHFMVPYIIKCASTPKAKITLHFLILITIYAWSLLSYYLQQMRPRHRLLHCSRRWPHSEGQILPGQGLVAETAEESAEESAELEERMKVSH